MDDTELEERRKRSMFAHDLQSITKAADLVKLLNEFKVEGSLTLLDDTASYTVCELWFDLREDAWMVDMKNYGEA